MGDTKGSLNGVLKSVLGFIDKPWKALAFGVFMILGLFCYLVYSQRVELAEAVLHKWAAARLEPEVFQQNAIPLLKQLHADAIELLQVNLEANVIDYIDGYDSDGNRFMSTGLPAPLIVESMDTRDFIQLIQGDTVCGDIKQDEARTGLRADFARGMRRYCIISVPPVATVWIGLLYVAWRDALPVDQKFGAKQLMRTQAMRFASW
jgi:hypothetical protein